MSRLSRPRDQIRILLLEGIHQSAVDLFRERGYTSVELLPGALRGDDLRARIADVHIVGLRSRTRLTARALEGARRLMAVGCFCIGTDQVALVPAAERGVPVFHAPHSNTRSVAELTLGLTVMLLRDIFRKSARAHAGQWAKTARGAHELRGKTLGIVGYGHIGSQVSILAEAFGMRVIYYDIVPKLALGNAHPVGSLGDLLAQSDVVTLHVPDTPLTRGMMTAGRLDQMRAGGHLINASRGTVVDVEALAERLRSGRLGGAAVDVHPSEPASRDLPFESPLRGVTNAILTPHIGGSTQEAQAAIGVDVAAQLVEYSDGGNTLGAVNFPQLNLAAHRDCHRVLHIHRNVPGVIGQINEVFKNLEINVLGQHLNTRDGVGYVVVDVEAAEAERVLPAVRAIEGTIRARILY